VTHERRHRVTGGRLAALAALAAVATLFAISPLASSSVADARSAVSFQVQLNGQRLDLSSTGDPIILDPDRDSTLSLSVRNRGDAPVTIRQVQLRGNAFGITLLAYDVTINALVRAHDTLKVDVPIEFVDLGKQVDGLLPATVRLLKSDRSELAAKQFVVDVRGSAGSLMTIFTAIVGIATGLSMLAIWIAIGRRQLPRSRIRRGVRLGVTGAGVGVTLTLFLAQTLLVTPRGSVWIPLVVAPTAGAFLLGYVSPGPLVIEDDDVPVEEWMHATLSPVASN
jgi:hypothetical protein